MYTTINKNKFIDAFASFEKSSGRFSQMGGYNGLCALFEYLEDYEEQTGEELKLDVIALCCDFTQYDSLEDVQADYSDIKDLDDLKDHTQVIEYDDGKLIIQQY